MCADILTLESITESAVTHNVPWLDALFIAVNREGVRSNLNFPRARIQLAPRGSDETWQVILSLDSPESPFFLDGESLSIGGEVVARVVAIENDDVVLTYVRGGGKSLTLNSQSRSTCTGCMFCPNVLEDASDATLDSEAELNELLEWVEADNQWGDLSHLNVITVCTGCFRTPEAAILHMTYLRTVASDRGFTGKLHLLSSVVRDRDHIEHLQERAGPFQLTLTLECFTRRELLLKDTKASLTLDKACEILDDCARVGMLGDFTYIAGLDPYSESVNGVNQLAEHATAFPRIQVFQAHNDLMRRSRNPEAMDLAYYLRFRNDVEGKFMQRGLAPLSWENYRPLWYTSIGHESVLGPRV